MIKQWVLAVLLCGLLAPGFAADQSWLVGKWEMTRDEDGDEKDWLEFTADGQAFNIQADGRRVSGQYVVTDNEVRITFAYKGMMIPITLKYGPDKQRLSAYSAKTKHTSIYERSR